MDNKRTIVSWGLTPALVVTCAALGRPVEDGQTTRPAAQTQPQTQGADLGTGPYMRAREIAGQRLTLEVAVRRFEPTHGGGRPVISLVSVSHIAESSLYEQLQELYDDIVVDPMKALPYLIEFNQTVTEKDPLIEDMIVAVQSASYFCGSPLFSFQ